MNAPDFPPDRPPPDRQRRISEIAHRIWESEGCPSGQAERHWQMAEKLVLAEEKQAAARHAKSESKPRESKLPESRPAAKKSPATPHKRGP
jgi:hypothetical protein